MDQFNDKNYSKQDFYLWEEGVTNLAYDDFLETKFITNIEYLGTGYNLVYANPKPSKGIDPGYTPYPAFEFKYQSDKLKALSSDADYFVPNGVELRSKTACQVSFESQEISSMSDYSHSLEAGVSIEGEVFAFSYNASLDYKENQSKMEKSDTKIVTTQAECMIHNLQIDRFIQPKWSEPLNSAFQDLLQNNSQENAWQFFEQFGTHVTTGVELGAKFGYQFELKSSEVEKMRSKGLSVEVGASGYGQDASAYTNFQQESSEAFKKAMTSWKQTSIGALPDEDNDALKWAQTVTKSPMPIQGKFVSWDKFIELFSKGNTLFTNNQLEQLENLLQSSLSTYCTGYLKPNNILKKCNTIYQSQKNYNVPGGKLLPNIDYTQYGGGEGYRWQNISEKCYDIAVDSKGYLFCIQPSDKKIKYRKFGENEEWTILNKQAEQIEVENGKMVIVNTKHQVEYKNLANDEDWILVHGNQNIGDICIDEQGFIWFIYKNNEYICFLTDPSNVVTCMKRPQRFVSCANGIMYSAYEGADEHYFGYDRQNAKKSDVILQRNSQPIYGCITEGGWGWKVQDDYKLWYMENVKEWSTYGNTDVDGYAHKIACASTPTGPIIVKQYTDYLVSIRVVDDQ